MKNQTDYTEADRVYGAWLAANDRIKSIDYGVVEEVYQGERDDLVGDRNNAACCYQKLTGILPK